MAASLSYLEYFTPELNTIFRCEVNFTMKCNTETSSPTATLFRLES